MYTHLLLWLVEYASKIGRGSVGLEILGFLAPELKLTRASAVVVGTLLADTLRVNHFVGFDRNWVKPEGDVERTAFGDGGGFGDSVFCGENALLG